VILAYVDELAFGLSLIVPILFILGKQALLIAPRGDVVLRVFLVIAGMGGIAAYIAAAEKQSILALGLVVPVLQIGVYRLAARIFFAKYARQPVSAYWDPDARRERAFAPDRLFSYFFTVWAFSLSPVVLGYLSKVVEGS
jgi:hypothetical protein